MRLLSVITVCICLLAFASPAVFAAEFTDYGQDELTDGLDEGTDNLFSLLGIEEYTYDELLRVSPERIFKLIIDIFKNGISEPLRICVISIGILIFVTLFSSFLSEGQNREFFETVGCISSACTVIVPVSCCAADCFASIGTTSDFMLTLIPILAGIVTAAGNPALALSFNTGVLAFAEGISVLIDNFLTALTGVYTAVCVSGILNPSFKPSGIASLIKKVTVFVLGLVASVFAAVLSVKGVIAGAADTVSIRGVRFLIGKTVPVVGSVIGESLNSLIAGFSLIKNTVGIIGIIAVALINLPSLAETVIWSFALTVLSISAEALGQDKAADFFTALRGLFSVLGAMLIFNSFVYIISVFIVITIKNTA